MRKKFVPLLYRQFEARPSTLRPFLQLNADLILVVAANTQRVPQLQSFPAPVRTVFGEGDRYLSPEQGRSLAALFPSSEAVTVRNANHFPQLDAPAEVARFILTVPVASG